MGQEFKPGNKSPWKRLRQLGNDNGMWKELSMFCRVLKPIVSLMRLVDSDMPCMGLVSSDLAQHPCKAFALPSNRTTAPHAASLTVSISVNSVAIVKCGKLVGCTILKGP